MFIRLGIDQLRVDPDAVRLHLRAAFQCILYLELAADLANRNLPGLVTEGGGARDNETARQRPGQVGDEAVNDPTHQIISCRILRQIQEWQNHNRQAVRFGVAAAFLRNVRFPGGPLLQERLLLLLP
jgi:hypothetical protein